MISAAEEGKYIGLQAVSIHTGKKGSSVVSG
jgi:hypothetical protein